MQELAPSDSMLTRDGFFLSSPTTGSEEASDLSSDSTRALLINSIDIFQEQRETSDLMPTKDFALTAMEARTLKETKSLSGVVTMVKTRNGSPNTTDQQPSLQFQEALE
jgi:hypothetical protein